MSAPTPDLVPVLHIQAIGRVLWEASRADEGTMSAIGADIAATAILTSTDPAVHAAMLDALARAGVMEATNEYGVRREFGDVEAWDGTVVSRRRYVAEAWDGTVVSRRRYVTPWEVAL